MFLTFLLGYCLTSCILEQVRAWKAPLAEGEERLLGRWKNGRHSRSRSIGSLVWNWQQGRHEKHILNVLLRPQEKSLVHCHQSARWIRRQGTRKATGDDKSAIVNFFSKRKLLQTSLEMKKISKEFDKLPSWLVCSKQHTPDFIAVDPEVFSFRM
jgi:hypothetical protein